MKTATRPDNQSQVAAPETLIIDDSVPRVHLSTSNSLAMLPYLLILLAFAIDRLSKWWAAAYLADHGVTKVNSLLTLYPTYNQGIAFGLLQGLGPAVGWLSIAIVVGLLLYLRQVPHPRCLLRIGLALIIGGALGNLIDRVTAGEVFDFIQTPFRPGVFNMADVMIQAGMILSLGGIFLQRPSHERRDPTLEIQDRPHVTGEQRADCSESVATAPDEFA